MGAFIIIQVQKHEASSAKSSMHQGVPRRCYGVLHQHADCHGADASGNGSDERRLLLHSYRSNNQNRQPRKDVLGRAFHLFSETARTASVRQSARWRGQTWDFCSLTIKVHVADEPDLPRLGVLDAVDAHVDDCRALFDHIGGDQPRNTCAQVHRGIDSPPPRKQTLEVPTQGSLQHRFNWLDALQLQKLGWLSTGNGALFLAFEVACQAAAVNMPACVYSC